MGKVVHTIYEIPGRKVGCTKNFEWRKSLYLSMEGRLPEIKVLQELENITDQEAGDIEWQWADRLGYKRGTHYTVTLNARRAWGNQITSEQKSRAGTLGGGTTKIRQLGIHAIDPTTHLENAGRGGLESNRRGTSGMKKRGTCPHCGIETNLALLGRWHMENCRWKKQA